MNDALTDREIARRQDAESPADMAELNVDLDKIGAKRKKKSAILLRDEGVPVVLAPPRLPRGPRLLSVRRAGGVPMTDPATTIRSIPGDDPTPEQQEAADALLEALTPRMEEPKWLGAIVMARCPSGNVKRAPHIRIPAGTRGCFRWLCAHGMWRWNNLDDPCPLTSGEFRRYRILPPAEPITDELVERCWKAMAASTKNAPDSYTATQMRYDGIREVLRIAGHPEAHA